MLDALESADDGDLRDGVRLAAAEQAVAAGLRGGGISLTELWTALDEELELVRTASGEIIEARRRAHQGSERAATEAVAALATALRSGPAACRRVLRELASSPLLDARGNSLFDAGAAAAAVTLLDEHFRFVPHIIGFSDRHFYSGNLRLMTQHPASETRDAIDVVEVLGERNDRGVNVREVAEVMMILERLLRAEDGSVGVVTPFRAQADALEEAILETFSEDRIEAAGIRVGTVHAFQGNERDVIVVPTALGSADVRRSLRFVEDPNLFNVMVTRARHRWILVTSMGRTALPDGLLRRYVRHAEEPPVPPQPLEGGRRWVEELAERLESFGPRVVANYPVAGWTVDLAVGEGETAVGVECAVHAEGAETHIERHLALRRAGWALIDAFESRWLADPDAAVDSIVQTVLGREDR